MANYLLSNIEHLCTKHGFEVISVNLKRGFVTFADSDFDTYTVPIDMLLEQYHHVPMVSVITAGYELASIRESLQDAVIDDETGEISHVHLRSQICNYDAMGQSYREAYEQAVLPFLKEFAYNNTYAQHLQEKIDKNNITIDDETEAFIAQRQRMFLINDLI